MLGNRIMTVQRTGIRTAIIAIFCTILAVVTISSCRKTHPATENTDQKHAKSAQTVPVRALSKDEQSCKAFVQDFYDWYVSGEVAEECKQIKKMHSENTDILNTCKRASEFHPVRGISLKQALSPKLKELLDKDSAKQAKSTDGIVGLDSDPFIGGNAGVIYNYLVDNVQMKNGKCFATVNEVGINGNYEEEGKIYNHLVAELDKSKEKWMISNIHFRIDMGDGKQAMDDDLIQMLK